MIGNLVAKILLVIFLLASPFLLVGFGHEIWKIISQLTLRSPKVFAFLIGGVLFFPVWWLGKRFFQTIWHYLTTLEHECTHVIVGLLFGKIPVSMRVSGLGGGRGQASRRNQSLDFTGSIFCTDTCLFSDHSDSDFWFNQFSLFLRDFRLDNCFSSGN